MTIRFQNRDIQGHCLNLGRGGLYCASDQRVNLGEEVEVWFGKGLRLNGEVVRVEGLDPGHFGLGVELPEPSETKGQRNPPTLRGTRDGVYEVQLTLANFHAFHYYRRLHSVLKRVEESGTDGITLAEAAELAHMEKTYFSDFFHKKVGVTFSCWIQYLRIAKAFDLIRTSNYSLTEVALESGFNDLSTFHKAFKRWTSMTPGEIKNLVRLA